MSEAPKQGPGALLFDLDGTLVDSQRDLATAVNRLLGEAGLAPLTLAAIAEMVGDGAGKLIARAFATWGRPDAADDEAAARLARFLAIYDEGLTLETRPYPGVLETLAALGRAGWTMAVCTNKPEAPSRRILAELGLEGFFAAVAGGDSFPTRKPDPGHLLAALASLGAKPAHSVMVGDSANDVTSAQQAGVTAVAVAYGYSRVPVAELGADCVIAEFHELPAALAALGKAT